MLGCEDSCLGVTIDVFVPLQDLFGKLWWGEGSAPLAMASLQVPARYVLTEPMARPFATREVKTRL